MSNPLKNSSLSPTLKEIPGPVPVSDTDTGLRAGLSKVKDPAILFYTSDFLTGTFTMTDEQVGKYIRLLCLQHQKGYLSEKDMLNICKSYDEDIFNKFTKNGDGKYYNERMKIEAEKRKNYAESRRNNRLAKKDTTESDEDINNISKSYDKHMENENINIDNKVKKVKFDLLTDGGWNNDLETYNGINTNYPKLFKMKRPLLFKEHERLVKKWGLAKIKDTYRDMEGWAELLKKRDWAAGCADAWNTREAKK